MGTTFFLILTFCIILSTGVVISLGTELETLYAGNEVVFQQIPVELKVHKTGLHDSFTKPGIKRKQLENIELTPTNNNNGRKSRQYMPFIIYGGCSPRQGWGQGTYPRWPQPTPRAQCIPAGQDCPVFSLKPGERCCTGSTCTFNDRSFNCVPN